ncbi:alpha/beta hydrolase [Lysobacter sp. 5GHs7-4]|uniref:alpha/beta hydrolase n=1 Tax=Lysobacter sp. 5GHs7-4 TaxID=2904253 RepID=UPI001E314BE3|nr:alpha/beta hydrolase-fold protein [Lysobacter sp. 5GHs7-4]UHQ25030.1 alpha/beta hydrolase [Lysobacter sp. 5GHs7-4]
MHLFVSVAVGLLIGGACLSASAAEPETAVESLPVHESFTMETRAPDETRRINVYMPPGYDAAKGPRYPVLYMPDGGLQEDFPHVASDVDAAIRAGEMRPMLVVGIENTQRRRDMTGPTAFAEDRKIAPEVGGSARFRAFIADDLMPAVRKRYRVSDETGIIGESLAGLFVVETFFERPELFDVYIAMSPSLWWNQDALVLSAERRLRAGGFGPRTLLLSSANEDNIAPQTARLADALRATAPKGLAWRYDPRPDLKHGTIYRALSPQLLRDAFPPKGATAVGKGK